MLLDYKNKKENYSFWLERLKNKSPNQVCTNDVGLDKFETNYILSKLSNNSKILEIGCGNGLLYENIRKNLNIDQYVGTDFVSELISYCNSKILNTSDRFMQLDMTEVRKDTFDIDFDFIISKRAIQNVLDKSMQFEIIDNFGYFLKQNGLMILIESSQDALQNINQERSKYGLKKINSPFHNLFFDDEMLIQHNFKNVELLELNPFSSDFYFITRIIYSRLAKEYLNEPPNYDHPLEKIALTMSNKLSTKDYSQLKCYTFIKK